MYDCMKLDENPAKNGGWAEGAGNGEGGTYWELSHNTESYHMKAVQLHVQHDCMQLDKN